MLSSQNQKELKTSETATVSTPPPAASKKKSRNKKKSKKSQSAKDPSAPVVKIPSKKTEASTNWKLLLSQKSAEVTAKKSRSKFFVRKGREFVQKKYTTMEKPQNETGDQAQSAKKSEVKPSDVSNESPQKSHDERVSFPPLKGLNALGCFDYTHYGHLKTAILDEHKYLTEKTPALAIDCEMVGVGPLREDALARVSIVNEFSYCLYDKFVKPKAEVTDYRTEFSGVREEDLKNAAEFKTVMAEVAEIIKGHNLIGHSLKSDFDVLFLKHPKAKIRDTALFYRKKFKKIKTPSLKGLVKDFLKVEIQKGEHNSITDAQAAMKMYLFIREDWEDSLSQKYNLRPHRYWLAREYRAAFKALGWSTKKKETLKK